MKNVLKYSCTEKNISKFIKYINYVGTTNVTIFIEKFS